MPLCDLCEDLGVLCVEKVAASGRLWSSHFELRLLNQLKELRDVKRQMETDVKQIWWRWTRATNRVKMRNGDTMLIMVKDGDVIHFTPNMSLPHSEFVKRTTKELPAGAWVGTVSKLDGEVAAITSKHFFGYQLPAPQDVMEAVRKMFK
jgi:hypothetical protein